MHSDGVNGTILCKMQNCKRMIVQNAELFIVLDADRPMLHVRHNSEPQISGLTCSGVATGTAIRHLNADSGLRL